MEIPENMCNVCFIGITSIYQIKNKMCHDCNIFNMGLEVGRNEARILVEIRKKENKLLNEKSK